MHIRFRIRWLVFLTTILLALPGCGGSDTFVVIAPGLVGIDDLPTTTTPPELTVTYTIPGVPGSTTATISSDRLSDGDISFDPFLNTYTITPAPDTLLFGIDSTDSNTPESRAFLSFPLDGLTGGPIIPSNANIVAADLTIFVNFVDFANRIPVLIDLVEYSVASGLAVSDYDSPPLATQLFNFFRTDEGFDVVIDVTSLMSTVQNRGLIDFQTRLQVAL